MSTSQLSVLRRKFGNQCHYCGVECNTKPNSARQATKEHVVPRTYGGANTIANYVLACSNCNNKRGVSLFYCECEYICGPLIRKALNSKTFIDNVFFGLINYNRHRVYQDSFGRWCSQVHHGRRHHESWQEAMDYVLSLQPEREKEESWILSR